MKKFLIMLTATLFTAAGVAQDIPRPRWAENPPASDGYAFYFEFGEAIGKTDAEAISSAFDDAFRNAQFSGGNLVIDQQALSDIKSGLKGQTLATNGIAVRRFCVKTTPHDGKVKAYVLVQVQKNANTPPNFGAANTSICDDPDFDRRVKEYGQKMTTLNSALMADGHNVYRNGVKLQPSEVLSIMDDTYDMRKYSAGLREWRKGRNCLIVGSILGIAGIGGLIYGLSVGKSPIVYVGMSIGIPMIIACPPLLLVGGIDIWSGSRQIEQAVDMHNSTHSRSVSKVEWGFGVTQQGLLGFVIKF